MGVVTRSRWTLRTVTFDTRPGRKKLELRMNTSCQSLELTAPRASPRRRETYPSPSPRLEVHLPAHRQPYVRPMSKVGGGQLGSGTRTLTPCCINGCTCGSGRINCTNMAAPRGWQLSWSWRKHTASHLQSDCPGRRSGQSLAARYRVSAINTNTNSRRRRPPSGDHAAHASRCR